MAFFCKTMLLEIYAKMLHHSFIPTIYRNFKSLFYLPSVNENLETCIQVWSEQLKVILRYFPRIVFKQMDIISKMQNIMFPQNYYM